MNLNFDEYDFHKVIFIDSVLAAIMQCIANPFFLKNYNKIRKKEREKIFQI